MLEKKTSFLLFFALTFCCLAFSQIVNVESLRKVSDTSKWSGNANLNFQLTQNNNRIIQLNPRLHVQYLLKEHLVLLVNDFDFKESNRKKLVNKGIFHLRYNYNFKPNFAWEVFTQNQFNTISNINYRFLLGSGPRFKISKSENYNIYLGTSIMFESEHLTEINTDVFHKHIRNSSYLSLALYPNKNISVVSTTYLQPRLDKLNDYRISNDTGIVFKLYKGLAFNTRFTIWHDQYPASNVRKTQYKWNNGFTYAFN